MARIKDPLDLNPPPPDPEEEARRAALAADPRPIWEIIAEIGAGIPEEELDKLPHNGSTHYREYLYGRKSAAE